MVILDGYPHGFLVFEDVAVAGGGLFTARRLSCSTLFVAVHAPSLVRKMVR
jgi:hypothetical protein